jgi:methionyl-tRNA formyltransferase
MRIIFFGTSSFAVPSLQALARDGRFDTAGVVTQPNRPVGRHAVMTPPAVKTAAIQLGVSSIQQPEKLKDESFQNWINTVGPTCDAFVIASYGKILPQWLLDLPKHGVINVHGSLLPRWRGASPIQATIAAGDTVSGVSVMLIDAQMDHGPVLARVEETIRSDDTGGSLHDRLAELGAKTLPQTIIDYAEGRLVPMEQDHAHATHCSILTRDDGKIDWTQRAEEIERLVRAYTPWPGTWTMYEGKRLKILNASAVDTGNDFKSGQCMILNNQPAVACGNGTMIVLEQVQPESKGTMSGVDFLRGCSAWDGNLESLSSL